MLALALLGYLPFFLMVTYDKIGSHQGFLPYWKQLFLIILGPLIGVSNYDTYFFYISSRDIDYLILIPFIIAITLLPIGIWLFKRSSAFKVSFFIGVLMWFWLGFSEVALYSLTT